MATAGRWRPDTSSTDYMRHLNQRERLAAEADQEVDAKSQRREMDAAKAAHERYKELHALPADHELCKYLCARCGNKFSDLPLVVCYVSMYQTSINEDGTVEVNHILRTDRGHEHHLTYCPDCAAAMIAHHNGDTDAGIH